MAGLSLSMGMHQSHSLDQRLEQRLAQKLKQEMTIKQVMELIQKLILELNLDLRQDIKIALTSILKNNMNLCTELPLYLANNPNPTFCQLHKNFYELRPVFNMQAKQKSDYGHSLRLGHVLVQRAELKHSMQLPPVNWNLVDAYDFEKDSGCKLPKSKIPNFEDLSLDEKLKAIDKANEIFKYHYTKKGKKFYKVPLLRNINVDPEDIALQISRDEYKLSTLTLEKAGRIQRIVRAVPWSEIRSSITNYLEEKNIDLGDAIIVGIDRGGRLPAGIVRKALGAKIAYYLKVDQSQRKLDETRMQNLIDSEVFKNKYILFVDSTVDSGRQISALSYFFDDEDLKKSIKHKGWSVIGSNEEGKSLEDHLNIDWGLNPDESFEDNPELLGVDYKYNNMTKIQACPSKTSTFLRDQIYEVFNGIVLGQPQTQSSKKQKNTVNQINAPQQILPQQTPLSIDPNSKIIESDPNIVFEPTSAHYDPLPEKILNLLIIGDGKNITLTKDEANLLALSIENRFNISAGTENGNPGYILGLVSKYNAPNNLTLFQSNYTQAPKLPSDKINVEYLGTTKDECRDEMIDKADLVLAIGGNNGTWDEIQKSLSRNKPTFVIGNSGQASQNAESLKANPNLFIKTTLEDAIKSLREYQI